MANFKVQRDAADRSNRRPLAHLNSGRHEQPLQPGVDRQIAVQVINHDGLSPPRQLSRGDRHAPSAGCANQTAWWSADRDPSAGGP